MRTLIYARFSSQLQNAASIGDQVAACRARAAKEGWEIVDVFSDAAISGAAGIESDQRPGLHGLLARVEQGGIDQVLAESTDRLARHGGDAFQIRERLEYARVRLFTLMDGPVDELTGTIKGLFDARFRKDLAARVKRGQRGAVERGGMMAVAYGYRRVARFDEKGEAIRGLREIDPDQAVIVQRIYREYVAGQSAARIVERLNAEGVPTPRGAFWRVGTLIGNASSRTSILTNPLYAGRVEYGRTRQVVDPRTRRRKSVKGEGDPIVVAAPHLRLVDDELWEQAQTERAKRATAQPWTARRPKHLLSGLVECGVCGDRYIKTSRLNWGCKRASAGRACENRRLVSNRKLERAVLAELKTQMLAADVEAAYIREYHREYARRAGETTRDRAAIERRQAEAARKVARLVDAIAAGADVAEVKEALATAKADKDRFARELSALDALPVLTLHPGLADRYRDQVAALESDLADAAAELEAVPRLRALIARVILTPRDNVLRGGLDIEVVRHIDELLALATAPKKRRA